MLLDRTGALGAMPKINAIYNKSFNALDFLTETFKIVNIDEFKDDLEYENDENYLLCDVEKALQDGDINDLNIPNLFNVNIDGQCIDLVQWNRFR
ncbi:unnamed protein product [Brachionus calyciflorus]|uniref:Uncharacterized protein n=1 Tax=Brachionus calyciflorus TaxID=104777 RepID=A0A814J209_9BILA|nr:unnamed protein product [Brachionus calyciflorus]